MESRKLVVSLVIGLSLCISIWHLVTLEKQQPQQLYETRNPRNAVSPNELSKNDSSRLIDLEDFEFLIAPRTCKELLQQPTLVVVVYSAANNFNERTVIRETWGSRRNDTRSYLLFLIGAVNSSSLQAKLQLESEMNGDLIQGNFEDTYRNLTYKHVMGLKWFIFNCKEARFLLRTDADAFVNLPLMNNYLEAPSELSSRFHRGKLLFGREVTGAKVKRSFRSKWRVPFERYAKKYYPNYCSGFATLYSADVVFPLYREAQIRPYFWIEDVYMTGVLRTKLNISILPSDSLHLNSEEQRDLLTGKTKIEDFPFFFAEPDLEEPVIRQLWELVKTMEKKKQTNGDKKHMLS